MVQVRDGVTGAVVERLRIRGGSGLGDAIYLRPVVDEYVRRGAEVTVCSKYGDVFRGARAKVEPFSRERIDVLGHYVVGKRRIDTNQWQDVCASAGVPGLALRFAWETRNRALIDGVRADARGRPVVLVHGGRAPMGRVDGFGKELLPQKRGFEAVLNELAECFLVRVGRGEVMYGIKTDVDLNGTTSVSDLLDLGRNCDGAVGQCSFMIPLCEAFDRPLLVVWAAAGMEAHRHPYIKSITPKKVLSKPSSTHVVDDWPEQKMREVARGFFETIRAAVRAGKAAAA